MTRFLAWLSMLLGAEPTQDERPICGDCQRRGEHASDCRHAPNMSAPRKKAASKRKPTARKKPASAKRLRSRKSR